MVYMSWQRWHLIPKEIQDELLPMIGKEMEQNDGPYTLTGWVMWAFKQKLIRTFEKLSTTMADQAENKDQRAGVLDMAEAVEDILNDNSDISCDPY